ncbi:MAG: DUF3316 domain-containing protein [Prevotella sp.]|nr:DUF3316 domain-containing protein [Prevotella sp.]
MPKLRVAYLFILLLPLTLCAQEKVWLAGIGRAAVLDTYISQEHYSGIEANLLHAMTKPLKNDSAWSRTHTYQLDFSHTTSRAGGSADYAAMLDYSFGMHRHFTVVRNLDIAVGAQGDFFAGGVYNTRGGNNPGQARLGIDIAPSVRAAYSFRLWRLPLRANYCISAPLLGVQFSPAYGQSYYEIFVSGNRDHNVCFAYPGNAPSLDHRLTVDLFFGKTALTIGYLGHCRQSKFHEIKYHYYSHSFVIGVTL